jgi:hypothetical protein
MNGYVVFHTETKWKKKFLSGGGRGMLTLSVGPGNVLSFTSRPGEGMWVSEF